MPHWKKFRLLLNESQNKTNVDRSCIILEGVEKSRREKFDR